MPAHKLILRFEVFKRDGFACTYCGRRPPDVLLHIDHIVPKSRGGSDVLDNLATACGHCNAGKLDVLLTEQHETCAARKAARSAASRLGGIASAAKLGKRGRKARAKRAAKARWRRKRAADAECGRMAA